jgi:hypothetical protein
MIVRNRRSERRSRNRETNWNAAPPKPPQRDLDALLEQYENNDFPKVKLPEEEAHEAAKAEARERRAAEAAAKDAEKIAAEKVKVQEIKAAKEAEAKAAEEKRQARIKELEELKESILKNRDTTPGFGLMAATSPGFIKAGNESLAAIDAELHQLRHGKLPPTPEPDPNEAGFRKEGAQPR